MQTDNAKQGSGLKKIFKWAAATFAAWAVTKMFDSYYDISLVSSLFEAVAAGVGSVGNSLGETMPIRLWMFLIILLGAGLIAAGGIWAMNDLKILKKASQEHQDRADADAKDAAANLKTAHTELDATKLALEAIRNELDTAGLELEAAYAKIADLQEPKIPPLTAEQDKVIAAIAAYDNVDRKCRTKELPAITELTLLQTDGALDVLGKRKLIQSFYPSSGKYSTLTAGGRAYVLHPDFMPPLLPFLPVFQPNPFGRI